MSALVDYEWGNIEKVLIADGKVAEVKLKKRYPPIKTDSQSVRKICNKTKDFTNN